MAIALKSLEEQYANGRTGKLELISCEMGLTRNFEILRRDICRFAVLCWVTRHFCRTRVYEGHFKLCYKEELKEEKSR